MSEILGACLAWNRSRGGCSGRGQGCLRDHISSLGWEKAETRATNSSLGLLRFLL